MKIDTRLTEFAPKVPYKVETHARQKPCSTGYCVHSLLSNAIRAGVTDKIEAATFHMRFLP